MTTRVFLDTNILIAYLLERDSFIGRILDASKKGAIESYTSIHVITEIVNIINRNETPKTIVERFTGLISEKKIKIIYDYSDKIISGSINVSVNGLSYEDLINLKIAEEKEIDYFITNDMDLIVKEKYHDLKIIASTVISELISGDLI